MQTTPPTFLTEPQTERAAELAENVAHRVEQHLAGLGQDQTAGVTMEERRLERFLERADLPADRRLRQVQ